MYFVFGFHLRQFVLAKDHPCSKGKHNEGVSSISEHDREKKRKCDDCVRSRVHFPVRGNPISVNEILEASSELVNTMVRRWFLGCAHPVQNY